MIHDFGSADDGNSMTSESLVVGTLGLDGFLSNVVFELLDTLPLNHPNHDELFSLLSVFVTQLTRKLRNWKKVSSFCW